jgi:aryl carrier-like protein
MALVPDLDSAIGRYAAVSYTDATPLVAAGLDSLTLLRLAADVANDDDSEIDAGGLVRLRTVADLKAWLRAIAAAGRTEPTC